jgi:LCP family protein required for cell wall assembly
MILCTLNPDTHEVVLTSFMRDMYVSIPGHKTNRINNAFSRGGVELLEQTIEENFDVHIDGYASIDFAGFIEAVAALGPMKMELTEEEAEYMNTHTEYGWADEGTVWHLKPGWNTLDQWQFLCYARMRHVGNSDWERTERQRKVLTTCYQQVKNSSVPKLLSLLDTVAPYITTDIRGADLISYAYMMAKDVSNIESNRIPADGTFEIKNINGMQVLVPDLEQNKAILQEYISNTRSNEAEAEEAEDASSHMGVAESSPSEGEYD